MGIATANSSTQSHSRGMAGLERIAPRRARVGLVAGGLGAYWSQFPALRPLLEEWVKGMGRFNEFGCEIVDAGFVSDPQQSAIAADELGRADCDLVVVFLTTYVTSSMVLPIAQRSHAPVLVIDLQPTAAMDHANTDTGTWLAYCGQCPLPEVANVFRRSGIDFRSVSGYLDDANAWRRIQRWLAAATARGALRTGRLGLMGHLYPGMLDISTDMTLLSSQLGSHIEVLEFDDLRVRASAVGERQVDDRIELARHVFEIDGSVKEFDLRWAARVSLALDQLVADFDLDAMAYYHRGLDGEMHEKLGAGMILGASLLTARGVPTAGEYDIRTAVAMLIADRLGAGGSFTELQALDFLRGHVEMGHDGPAHLASQLAAGRCSAGWASITASAAGACRSRVRRHARPGDRPRTAGHEAGRGPRLCLSPRGPRCGRPAPADRQHHLEGGLRMRPRRVDRRLERDRHLPPLGPGHRPPFC